MKVFTILIACLMAGGVCAQTVALPTGSAAEFLAGERTPVFWSGSGVVMGSANSYTTAWMQIGQSPSGSRTGNINIARFNPEKFALTLKIGCYGGGDSARISSGVFEMAYDTTGAAAWSADSSNIVLAAGSYDHPQYGVCRFEALSDTARSWDYPLRVIRGGFLRFHFRTTTADSVRVNWTLWGEN